MLVELLHQPHRDKISYHRIRRPLYHLSAGKGKLSVPSYELWHCWPFVVVVPQRQVPPQDASHSYRKRKQIWLSQQISISISISRSRRNDQPNGTPQGVYKSRPSAQASTESRSRTILDTLHCAAACSLQNSSDTDRCRRPEPASPNQFLNQSACEAGQVLTYCIPSWKMILFLLLCSVCFTAVLEK
jgi:hypothetical protein